MNWITWPKSYSLPYSNAKRKNKFQDEMNSAIILLFHSLILQFAKGNQRAKIATYSQYKNKIKLDGVKNNPDHLNS